MQDKRKSNSEGQKALLSFCLAGLVYLTMLFGPLAQLRHLAGQPPFDLRFMGYSGPEAEALLQALGAEGRQIYVWQQLPLDLLYPGLLAATLWFSFKGLARAAVFSARWQIVLAAGRVLALLACVGDYSENLMIWQMLRTAEKAMPLDPALVALASSATLLKSLATSGSVTILLVAFSRRILLLRGPK